MADIAIPNYNFLSENTVKPVTEFANNVIQMQRNQLSLQQDQAQQEWSTILAHNTGPDGVPDFRAAAAEAAHSPVAARGMMAGLTRSSPLQSDQIRQGNEMALNISRGSMSIMNDSSDANVNQTFDMMVRMYPGQSAALERERQTFLGLPPAQRGVLAYQHGVAGLDASGSLSRSPYGVTTVENTGGSVQPATTTQASPWSGATMTPGRGGVGFTLTPGEAMQQGVTFQADERWVKEHPETKIGQTVYLSGPDKLRLQGNNQYIPPGGTPWSSGGGGGGVVNPDGSRASPQSPPRLLPVPGQQPPPASGGQSGVRQGGAPPPPPGGTTGAASAYSGGGIGAVLAKPGTTPPPPAAAPPPAAVAPPAASSVPMPTPPIPPPVAPPPAIVRPQGPLAMQGGSQVASTNALIPPTGPGSAPGPAVPGDVNAMLAGMRNAQTSPRGGVQTANAVSFGPGVQEQSEWKASSDRLAQDDQTSANFAQTQFPFVQALGQYGKGTVTGPTADFWNRVGGYIRTPLQKLGMDVPDLSDANKRYDALNKWLAQIVSTTPFAAGSDARMAEVLNGSANTHISQAAGEDMLKAGIILQRMTVAANNQWHNMTPQEQAQYGGLYLNFLRNYSSVVDPRAFGTDMYNKDQKANLRAALKAGSEADAAKYNATLRLASGIGSQQPLP